MFRSLAPGKLMVDYGPISMVIEAYRNGKPLDEAIRAGGQIAVLKLQELTGVLEIAKTPVSLLESQKDYPPVLLRMIEAVKATGEPDATPMAAVAGTIADEVLYTLVNYGATRAVVNNGGDIAIHVGAEKSVRVGVISDFSTGRVSHCLELNKQHQVGGIATSGMGGRSFTKGIASAVVVLAETAARADACATMLANAVNADHPEIIRTRAELIDPQTDIKGQQVTLRVGKIDDYTIDRALQSGQLKFYQYLERGLLRGVIMSVQDRVWMYPGGLAKQVV